MKKILQYSILAMFCFLMGSTLWAVEDDIKSMPECKYCGMNRETFSHSRMVIKYNDGTSIGTCSLHCAALDLALNIGKIPEKILVGDYGTKELIDAETATWVIGGDKHGVMTKNAKWAFAQKADAENFRKEHEGNIAGFEEALETSYKDLGHDTKMLREKRKMMKMKK